MPPAVRLTFPPFAVDLANEQLWRGEQLIPLRPKPFAILRLEQGISLYDPQQALASAFDTVQHPGVACLCHIASALWSLGYPDEALKRINEALALAQGLSHPFSLACALNFVAFQYQLRREGDLAQQWISQLMTLASEQGFPFWLGFGTILGGWTLAEQGQVEEGIAQVRKGLAAYRAIGTELWRPYFLALLAEAYGKTGQIEKGLSVLAEALALIDEKGERFYEAELYRLKGELTLQSQTSLGQAPGKSRTSRKQVHSKSKTSRKKSGTDPRFLNPEPYSEAEACFQKAIAIARKQQAKSLELRTTVSIARLWRLQGKQKEAHQMLSEIYGWFTEGFDTKDLQEAKALIEELSH